MKMTRTIMLACSSALCVQNMSANWTIRPFVELSCDASCLLNKKVLIGGAVVGGVATAGYLLYRYFWVMTLPQAHQWCDEVDSFVTRITQKYQREIAIIRNESIDIKHQKEALWDIAAENDTDIPYTNYVKTLEGELYQADRFESQVARGVPQLESALFKIARQLEEKDLSDQKREQLTQQVQQYRNTLKTMLELRLVLRSVRASLGKINNYCKQCDGYRQEQLLQKLNNLEMQMMLNNVHYHHCRA